MDSLNNALRNIASAILDGTIDQLSERAACGPHPRDEDLLGQQAGRLDAQGTAAIRLHLFLCEECRIRDEVLEAGQDPDAVEATAWLGWSLVVRPSLAVAQAAAALLPSAGPPADTPWLLSLHRAKDGAEESLRVDELAESAIGAPEAHEKVAEVRFCIRVDGRVVDIGGFAIKPPRGAGVLPLLRRARGIGSDAPVIDIPMGALPPGDHELHIFVVTRPESISDDKVREARASARPDGVIPITWSERAQPDLLLALLDADSPVAVLEVR